jgi:tRNA threonylcarbamoyl adenosine modification protein YeaZ
VLVLTLDTSTPAVTVAVSDVSRPQEEGGWFASPRSMVETLAAHNEVATNRHGELLAPMIEQVLSDAGVAPGELDAVGVGLGPGPFTGLRVGIMTAAALGDALGIPVYGECSLDILGSWPLYSHKTVVADARRKQVYWATYDHGRRVDGPDLDVPEAIAARIRSRHAAENSEKPHQVVGAGAALYSPEFEEFWLDLDHQYPTAEELAVLLWQKVTAGAPGDELTPLYLRRPDATPPGRPKQVTPA